MIYSAGLASIQKQTASLLHTQQQVASGRRILTPADDPVAAARALEVEQAQNTNALYQDNQKAAGESLGLDGRPPGFRRRPDHPGAHARRPGRQCGADRPGPATASPPNCASASTSCSAWPMPRTAAGSTFSPATWATPRRFPGRSPRDIVYAGDEGQRQQQVSASRQIAVSDSGNDVFMRIRNGNGSFATPPPPANAGSGVIDPAR
jgi:flagellar hook-associated protein 3 FlgL